MAEKRPYRAEYHFTFAVTSQAAAGVVMERVAEALKTAGVFPEGGSAGVMDTEDVIVGSPLASAVASVSGRQAK